MLRKLVVVLLAALPVGAAILPDKFGAFVRGESRPLAASDPALFQEFGFQAGEQADYKSPSKRFTVSAWRLHDSTGALALFEAQRPPEAAAAKLAALFAKTSEGAI